MESRRVGFAQAQPPDGGVEMRAVVQDRYGPAEALQVREIRKPEIGDDGVLVRVHAAGVDPGVWHLTTGLPYLVRAMGYGLLAPRARVPGVAVAGRVEAIGRRVTRLREGDAVYGTCEGAFAEYARTREDRLAPKPVNLGFVQAAAVPVSAVTALQALRDMAELRAGQKVLVIGAAGGVGTFAVQLAKAFGAEVTGVCSTTKLELVRAIGADHVIDYTRDDFGIMGRCQDVIVDTAGNRRLSDVRRALAPSGTLVLVGGEGGGRWLGGAGRLLRALLLSPFVPHRLRPLIAAERREDLLFLTQLIESGRLAPVIDRTYSLGEVPAAIRYLAAGRARGKVVIRVTSDDAAPGSDAAALATAGVRAPGMASVPSAPG